VACCWTTADGDRVDPVPLHAARTKTIEIEMAGFIDR
jgi:hypothetical protein